MAPLHEGGLGAQVEAELVGILPGLLIWARKHATRQYDAESMVTDTVITFLQNPGRYQPSKGTLKRFLSSCLRNKALDFNKNYHRRYMEDFRLHLSRGIPLFIEQKEDAPLWHDRLMGQVEAQLRLMSRERSSAFRLFVFGGKRHKEIAQELGTSVGAVKTNIFRAKASLREYLGSFELS